jgi:hypothetical protein
MTEKFSWKQLAVKVQQTIYHPTVMKVSRLANEALDIIAAVDTKNPLSVVSAGMAMVSASVDAFELPQPDKLYYFVKKHNITRHEGELAVMLFQSGFENDFPTQDMFEIGESLVLREASFSDTDKFYYLVNNDSSTARRQESDKILRCYFVNEGFDFKKIFDYIWNHYGPIYIKRDLGSDVEGSMKIISLPTSDMLYIGDIDVESFTKEVMACRGAGISRSYMLIGAPGGGKTSFALTVAQKISNKVLKLDPSSATVLGQTEIYLKNLKPDVVIFDDFDRLASSNESSHLLFFIESLKASNPNLVIFATVNDFSFLDPALTRPGRFDEKIWFDDVSDSSRKKIVETYLTNFKVAFDDKLVSEIASKTKSFSAVYIKELCMRVSRKGPSIIDASINEFDRCRHGEGVPMRDSAEKQDDGLSLSEEQLLQMLIEETAPVKKKARRRRSKNASQLVRTLSRL